MPSPYLNDLIRIAKTDLPQLAHDLENASTIYTVQEAAKRLHNVVTYILHHVIMSDPSVAAAAAAAQTTRAQPSLPPPPAGYSYGRGQDGKIYLVPAAPPAAPAHAGHAIMASQQGQAIGQPPAVDHYPSQQPAAPQPIPLPTGLPLVSLVPAGAPINPNPGQGNVVDVTITPRGSRVVTPGGETMLLPPGAPIDATGGLPGIPMVHDYHQAQPPVTSRPQFTTPAPAQVEGDVVLPQGGGMTPAVAAALAGRSADLPMMDASGGARNITDQQP